MNKHWLIFSEEKCLKPIDTEKWKIILNIVLKLLINATT